MSAELLLLDPLTAEVDARQGALAGELRGYLDAIDEETYPHFFPGAGQRPHVPRRAAHLIGYRVARHVAEATGATGASLPELARMRRPELRDRVDEALAALAAGAPSGNGRRRDAESGPGSRR